MSEPVNYFVPPQVDPIAANQAEPAFPAVTEPFVPTTETTSATESQDSGGSDWESERAALLAERERIAQERDEAQQRISAHERHLAERAAMSWQQAEQQLERELPNMDPDDAVKAVREFSRQREQFLIQQNQASQQQLRTWQMQSFASDLIQENGLTEADRVRLLYAGSADPNQMVHEAQRIKSERESSSSELEALRKQVENLTRAVSASNISQSGAWRTGGSMAPAANGPSPERGSLSHLASLLGEGHPALRN